MYRRTFFTETPSPHKHEKTIFRLELVCGVTISYHTLNSCLKLAMRIAHYMRSLFCFSRSSDIICLENMTQALNSWKGTFSIVIQTPICPIEL